METEKGCLMGTGTEKDCLMGMGTDCLMGEECLFCWLEFVE